MIIVTVKYELDKKLNPEDPCAPGVNVELENTQNATDAIAHLRPGESVEHRLRLDATGVVNLRLLGWPKL